MTEEIILCRCVFGGYDFCADCGGSGVIIKHTKEDYTPIKTTLLLPTDHQTQRVLTIDEKNKKEILYDDSLISFLIKNFHSLRLGKRIKTVIKLEERIKEWKRNIPKIKNEELQKDVLEYIIELEEKVKIARKASSEKNYYRKKDRYSQIWIVSV